MIYFCPVWPWNLTDDFENNRAPLLHYLKLFPSFQSHSWIQTRVSPETLNLGQNQQFFVLCDLQIWWMTHRSPPMSSFVLHITAIDEFKLEFQSGNAKLGSKSAIFLSHVTMKFNGWPWKTIRHFFYTMLRFVHHLNAISAFKLKLQWGNFQFWSKLVNFFPVWPWNLMTLKNDRAPLLCYFKLCAAFRTHWWIQTGVTVRKRPIWVKFDDF